MQSQVKSTKILEEKLKKLDCHFTWSYSEETFQERQSDNEQSCLNHIEETPDQTVYNFLAYLYFKDNQKEKAQCYFEEAVKKYPEDPVTLANLAHFYFSLGMAEKSIQYLEKAKICEKNFAKGHILWSKAYFETRMFRYKAAIDLYDLAILKLPNERSLLLLLKAILLNRDKKFSDALLCLEEAKKTMPQNSLIYLHLGRAYGGLKGKENKVTSKRYFEEALCLSQQKENVYKFIADGFRQQGKKQINAAIEFYNKSIAEKENTMAYHHRGLAYKKKNDYPHAIADFKKSLDLKSTNHSASIDLIDMHCLMKDYQALILLCSTLPNGYQNSNARVLLAWGKSLLALHEKQSAEEKFLKLCLLKYAPHYTKIEAKKYLIECYTQDLESENIVESATKLLKLYMLLGEVNNAKEHIFLYYDSCSKDFDFCYQTAKLYLISQETKLFGSSLEQAFFSTHNRQGKNQCYDLYLQAKNQEGFAEHCLFFLNQYELEHHKNDRPIWSKNLTILFKSKQSHKNLLISSGVHEGLKMGVTDKHVLQKNKKFSKANFNKAIIHFIVSDREHNAKKEHGRKCVSVPLYENNQQNLDEKKVQHVTDYYEFCVGEKREYKRSELLLEDVLLSKPAYKSSNINAMFKGKTTPTFHRTYHCSERALFGFLQQEETINCLLDEIDAALNNQTNIKFYAFILDIHSDRYLCDECEESVYYWYDPKGVFLEKLVAAIQERGHKVQTQSNTLDSVVRVSAKQPANKQTVMLAEAHRKETIDIKEQRKNTSVTLLQRDDTSFETERSVHNLVFSSAK